MLWDACGDKSFNYTLVDLACSESASTKPAGEMFDDLNIGLNSRHRVAAGLQIESELLQNYAEMAGGHPASNEGSKE